MRNVTVRLALTLTIAGFTAALMRVIAASIAGLKTANRALEKMYSEETAALQRLDASSEALLDVQVDPQVCDERCTQAHIRRMPGKQWRSVRDYEVERLAPFGIRITTGAARRTAVTGNVTRSVGNNEQRARHGREPV